jgi:surface carbohydrate biosynthesis protein
MAKKYLYLPIEAKTRELDAKLLLTYYAIKANYNVVLGDHTPIFQHLHLLPKGIIFSKGHPDGDARKGHMANAKKKGYTLVELDEEGLIFGPKYTRFGSDDKYLRILEHVYCWGRDSKENITKIFPSHKEKFYITGHPRFDLLKKKYRELYKDEVKIIKQKYGDFILINTRFTRYNHFQTGFNHSERYIKSLYEHFQKLIKVLSEKYPHLNIVVRPHIHESLTPYINEFKPYKNVFVVHDGSVGQWIMASRLVIHNSCTTGIEAFLLDKPVISYLPINHKTENNTLPNMVTDKAFNLEQLLHFINIAHLSGDKPEKKRILSHYYAADNTYAYENIIHLLNKLNVAGENSIKDSTIRALSLKMGKHTMTSEEEIKSFFERLNVIENSKHNISIKSLAPDLFEIKSLA